MFGEKLKGDLMTWHFGLLVNRRSKKKIREVFIISQMSVLRCWPRRDNPQCLQSLWPGRNRNLKERFVSIRDVQRLSVRGAAVHSPSLRLFSVTEMLTTQADRFSAEEVCAPHAAEALSWQLFFFSVDISIMHFTSCPQMEQMFVAFPPDVAGNLDYKNLVHIITHGEEKDQE